MRQAGSLVVGDTIRLNNESSVYNLAVNVVVNNNGTILGTATSPMPVPLVTLPAFPTVVVSTKVMTVTENKTLTLAPGSYGFG